MGLVKKSHRFEDLGRVVGVLVGSAVVTSTPEREGEREIHLERCQQPQLETLNAELLQ